MVNTSWPSKSSKALISLALIVFVFSSALLIQKAMAATAASDIFAANFTMTGGGTVGIPLNSNTAAEDVWFAPADTASSSLLAGATMTTAAGDAVTILAPATAGSYVFYVVSATGEITSTSTAVLTVDNTAPTFVSASITAANQITVNYSKAVLTAIGDYSNLTFSTGSTSNVTGLTGSGTATIILTFDGTSQPGNATATIDIAASVTDIATNVLSNSGAGKPVADGRAPVVAITAPLATTKVTGATLITFTDSELTSAECSINAGAWVACESGVTVLASTTGFAGLGQGAFILNVRDTDLASNVGSDSEAGVLKDTVGPVATVTYDHAGAVKSGDVLTITADFDENVEDAPVVQIEVSGTHTLAPTEMVKTSATQYYATTTIGAGNGSSTVAFSVGTDALLNVVTATPASGADFMVDNTAPVIAGHGVEIAEATSSLGAYVTYTSPDSTDAVDGTVAATCLPASGTQFALGSTTVTCNITDGAGNVATPVTFEVFIQDTIAPVIAGHGIEIVEATSSLGAYVTYTSPDSTDAVDGTVAATCLPASGTQFALGSTTVTCNITDGAGNVATPTTFEVFVQDTTAPAITVNGSSTLTFDLAGFTPYSDAGATYTDAVDGGGTATTTGTVDSTVGTYYIVYSAIDANLNESMATRTVTVIDSIATVFSGISASLASQGVVNNFNTVQSSNVLAFTNLYFEKVVGVATTGRVTFAGPLNLVSTTTQEFLQNLGTKMDMDQAGKIGLDVTASDFAGVEATIEFYNVVDSLGLPAMSDASTTEYINSKMIARNEAGDVLPNEGLISTTTPGTYLGACNVNGICQIFAVGVNHFTSFEIDVTPPVINAHANVLANSTSNAGATVTFIAPTSTDAVSGVQTATCDATSGALYPVGTTTVTCNVSDDAGNAATSTNFKIVVTDVTAPTAALAYSNTGTIYVGSNLTITATFDEPMNDSPVPTISLSGANAFSATAMSKVSSTVYIYSYTVTTGSGVATATLGSGVDMSGNSLVSVPTSGVTFTVVQPSSGGAPANTPPAVVTAVGVPLTVTAGQSGSMSQTLTSGKVIVDVPKGAVTNSTTFDVKSGQLTLTNKPSETTGAFMIGGNIFNINASANGSAVRSFASNLTISITTALPADTTDLGVYYFNDTTSEWVLVPGATFDSVTGKVTFSVNHLTQFSIIKVSGTPLTIKTVQAVPELIAEPVKTVKPVIPAKSAKVAKPAQAAKLSTKAAYPNGSLLKSNNKLYLVTKGVLVPVKTNGLFNEYRKNKIVIVSTSVITNYKKGTKITSYENGKLIKGAGKGVYIVKNGQKYLLTPAQLKKYKNRKIIVVRDDVLANY